MLTTINVCFMAMPKALAKSRVDCKSILNRFRVEKKENIPHGSLIPRSSRILNAKVPGGEKDSLAKLGAESLKMSKGKRNVESQTTN